MRNAILFSSVCLVVAGCPSRTTPTVDVGPIGVDVPRMDAPGSCTMVPEDTVSACSDGCSNDGDTFVDCEEGDCCGVVSCLAGTFCGDRADGGVGPVGACDGGIAPEDTVAACSDGCDNDDNGFFDCGDFDCCGVVTCGPTTACGRRDGGDCAVGPENTAATCGDGCSNDGDTYVDCEDRDCCGAVSCAAGTFCGDLGDAGPRRDGGPRFGTCDGGTRSENSVAACGNGCDDDGDGYSDCSDYGCCGLVACGPTTSCGRVDGGGCVLGLENTATACGDGCSNDGDRFIDCEDRDCCRAVSCGPTTYCGSLDAGVP